MNPAIDETDEDASPEWEQIKNYVGGGNKASKHPIALEAERLRRRAPQHMDEGGEAGDMSNILQEIAPPGVGTLTPSPARPPVQPPPAITAPVSRGTIPPVATPPIAPNPAPAPPTDESYDAEASKILGGITPDTINQLMQSIQKSNAKGQIGAGIAGIGDAIAKGVGRTDQNRMAETEANLKSRQEQALKTPELMAQMGKERYGLSHELQSYDPGSPFSKVSQNANRQLLKTMGATDAQISTMPATAINDVVSHQVDLKKALAEIEQTGAYHAAELGFQKAQLENTQGFQKAQQNLAGEQKQQEAAKTLTGRGPVKQFIDWATKKTVGNPALETLEKQAGGGEQPAPTINSQAEYDALPAGTKYIDSHGQQATKR